MRILIAPDKFKGSLTAAQAANAIAQGLLAADPSIEIDLCPMADGGEGTVDALVTAMGGSFHTRTVTGPLPNMRVEARFGTFGPTNNLTAVIEMSAASGLSLVPPHLRNPDLTTSFGTGELLLAAAKLAPARIILGIGGSATIDGGLGAAQACGARIFTLPCNASLPTKLPSPVTGADLLSFHSMTVPNALSIPILVACDVTNPLCGLNGAAPVFGPQKGATAAQVALFDEALQHLASRTHHADIAIQPGAGAAGGMGFALIAFFGATLSPGIDLVMSAVHFHERLKQTNLCITGEGSLDIQSLSGKTPVGIAAACRQARIPCHALAGSVNLTSEQLHSANFASATAIASTNIPLTDRISQAEYFLRDAAFRFRQSL